MGSILSHGSRVGPKSRFASATSPEITASVNPSVCSSSSATCSTTSSSSPSAASASSGLPPTETIPVVSSEVVPSEVVSSDLASPPPPLPPPLPPSFDGGGWPQPATISANSAPSSQNAGLPGPLPNPIRLRKRFPPDTNDSHLQ